METVRGRDELGSSVGRALAFVAAAVGAVLLLAVAGILLLSNGDNDHRPNERLGLLRAALSPEPAPPGGAVLVSRREFQGNNSSDGPAIEWQYKYTGTSSDFVAHYRSVLLGAGWTEVPPGNMPNQLANFERPTHNGRVVLVVLGSVQTPHDFELLALG